MIRFSAPCLDDSILIVVTGLEENPSMNDWALVADTPPKVGMNMIENPTVKSIKSSDKSRVTAEVREQRNHRGIAYYYCNHAFVRYCR